MKTFDDIKEKALASGTRRKIGIIAAHDEHTLEAAALSLKEKISEPVLYGNTEKIKNIWQRLCPEIPIPQMVHEPDNEKSLDAVISDVKHHNLDGIMKGNIETGTLMKAIVNKNNGICKSACMSLLAMMQSPYYHKVFAVSDVGLLTYPSLEQKKYIIKNAVAVFHKLGIPQPKVAVLAAIEKVNPKMPETIEAARLKEMAQQGIIKDCLIEGPISYDLCMDKSSADIKGFKSSIAGDPDILIVPDIVSGNLLSKSLTCTGGAITCGTVVGGCVPIILTSRSASVQDKYLSIVLASAIGGSENIQA